MRNERPDEGSVIEGVAAGLAGMLVVAGVLFIFSKAAPATSGLLVSFAVLIGLTQLVYILPIVLAFLAYSRKRAALGVVVFAALVFLLNATCFGLIVTGRLKVL